MKKKLMSVMLVIAMVLSMVPTAFAAEVDVEAVKAEVEAFVELAKEDPDAAYAKAEEAYEDAYAKAKDAAYIADALSAAGELAAELDEVVTWAEAEGVPAEYLDELKQEVAAAQAVLKKVTDAIKADDLATLEGAKNVAWELVPELEECLDHVVHALLLAAEDAEEYANAEIIPALEAKAAELEEKWETEWKPALEETVEELIAEAKAAAEAALGEAYDALVEAAVEAAQQYGPEVADAIYDYLYNNPDKVIAFVKEYSGDVAAFIGENQEEILAVLGYLAATYGEDVVNFVLENDQEILETMVDWYAVHGDNFEALVLVYLEELGVIDAAEDLYAEIEELLGESIEDIEAAIEEIIAEVEAAIEELEAAAEELKAQLEELKAELENAADETKAEIEAAIAEIEAAIEEIEAMLEELQAKVEELIEIAENIYDATQAVIDAVLMAGEDFDAAVAALQEALTALAEAVGAAEEFIAEMNDAIAEAAEWASDAIAALGDRAEEIVAGVIEVMETVEEIVADVQNAIEEAAAEIVEAYEAFKQALYDATHETVYGCAIDTYVALGGDAIGSDEDASYVEALAAYVGASEITKLNQLNYFEDAVAYVEENQGDIEDADLITYQMEATAFIVPFIDNLMGEIDWSAYLNDEAIAFAEEVKADLLAELAKKMDAETLEAVVPMAENAVYCAVSFAVETVKALETINAINPEAPVLVIGMYNPLAGLTATVNGEEIAVGEMVEYAMKATDLYYLIYAVATGNVTFVDACGTDINGYDGALDVDAIAEAVAFVMEGDFSKYEEMLAAATFIETTVTDVMNSMLTSDEGQDDIYAAIEEALTVESHKWNAGVITAPTCEDVGYTTYTCVLCGETYTDDATDAIGHAYGAWTDNGDGTHSRVCANDASHVETAAHDFTNDDCVCGAKKPAEEEDDKPSGGSSGGSSRDWHCPTCKSDTCHSKAYTDLDLDAWYHEYTDYVLCKGMMNGMGGDIFAPNAETTRAMLTTVIYRIAGSPAVTGEMPFADVAEGQWYSDAILWAAQNDVVLGYGDGNFGPMDVITREQIAALFCRFAELKGMNVKKAADLSAYTDADQIGAWAVDYVEWAVATGLMQGRSASTLAPAAGTTRAEAAALLERWCEEIAD